MKNVCVLCLVVLAAASSSSSQVVRELSLTHIKEGTIVYFESGGESTKLKSRLESLARASIVLKNSTLNRSLAIPDSLAIIYNARMIAIYFRDPVLKNMENNNFALFIDDSLVASTSTTGESASHPLSVDFKPSFDLAQPQEMDVQWRRRFLESGVGAFAGNMEFEGRGALSTRPDSGTLNSIQLRAGYTLIWADAGVFKYVGLNGKIGSEHPQDFSETNLVGSLVLSTILPRTDVLARFIADNTTNSSPGLLVQPAIEIVKNTTVRDSSFVRGAIHGSWDIPLMKDQYASLYAVVYFQDGYRPRSYIEMTLVQSLSPSIAFIAKWVNGELPPLFSREADLRLGLRFQ